MTIVADLATKLRESFVNKPNEAFSRMAAGTANAETAFLNKVRVYREAAVIFCLWSAARKTNRHYGDLLESYERLVFSTQPTNAKAAEESEIRNAVGELQRLVSTERGELMWSRDWMLGINVNETNPATLAQFALAWRTELRTILLVLKDWLPLLTGSAT